MDGGPDRLLGIRQTLEKMHTARGDSMIPNDWQWNEAIIESNDQLNEGILMLMVIGHDLVPVLIGTAFLIAADGNRGTAISAAHCFEHVEHVLHPNKKHHTTTPTEFLPPPEELDLIQVKAIYQKNNEVYACPIELAFWDSGTDLAALTVLSPSGEQDLFRAFFWIDDQIPDVGEQVLMVGVGEMKVIGDIEDPRKGMIERRLVVRIGYVEQVSMERTMFLKSPSVQTSIAVYGGMSGGLVAKFTPGNNIKPFAFISHSPEELSKTDRSVSGHSMGSILKAKLTQLGEGKQSVQIEVNIAGVGKTEANSEDGTGPD